MQLTATRRVFTASMKHLYKGAVITAGPPPKA